MLAAYLLFSVATLAYGHKGGGDSCAKQVSARQAQIEMSQVWLQLAEQRKCFADLKAVSEAKEREEQLAKEACFSSK